MKTYARIENAVVVEIIPPMTDGEGNEIAIEERFHPDIVATLVDTAGNVGISVGWTYQNGAFAAPEGPNLTMVKAQRKAAIRDYRDSLLLMTPFNGKTFQTDVQSKIQIMVLAGQSTLPPSASQWRTADNSYMPMTLTLFQQLMGTIMTREGAAFTNSSHHQDAIDAMTDAASVGAYDFSTGWPA